MLPLLLVCRAAPHFVHYECVLMLPSSTLLLLLLLAADIQSHAKGDRDEHENYDIRTPNRKEQRHRTIFLAMLTLTSTTTAMRERVIEIPACQRCVRCVKIDVRVANIVENEQCVYKRVCVSECMDERWKTTQNSYTIHVVCAFFCSCFPFKKPTQVFLRSIACVYIHLTWSLLTRANCCFYTSII